MTVDIVHSDRTALATLGGASEALDRLGQWVTAAQQAHQLVAPLVTTAFVPEAYKPKVDPRATPEQKHQAYEVAVANATAAVLQGITLGLDPLTALQQIYIVHGRPGMYTNLMVALVKSRGHEVWTEDLTDTRAVVCGRRRGDDLVERRIVTMDQARKAGWTSNQAYAKTPQDMLYARAAGRVCKAVAPEVLMGIASVEEIQDELAPAGNGTRTVRPPARRALPAAPPEPPLDDDGTADVREILAAATDKTGAALDDIEQEMAERGPGITQAQQRKLHALLKENDLADRAIGLAYISEILGWDVTSTKDLSKREAGIIIDRLDTRQTGAAELATEEPPLDDTAAGDQ